MYPLEQLQDFAVAFPPVQALDVFDHSEMQRTPASAANEDYELPADCENLYFVPGY